MARLPTLELPRPKTFFHYMSLRTGTELITLSLVINKLSGFYGILALFTGKPLNPLQLSMYIYSLFALGAAAYLACYIRKQSPLQNLALAWLYVIDSVINALYTAAFGVVWFLVLASQPHEKPVGSKVLGGSTMGDTSGFTSPKYNVSQVDVVATPAEGLSAGQDAVAVGSGEGIPAAGLGDAIFQRGSIMSITLIVAFWLLRLYFILVVMAYARGVLRQYIVATSTTNYTSAPPSGTSAQLAENPFAEHREEGRGWQGKLGRTMVRFGKTYWLGSGDDGEWMRSVGGKFSKLRNVGVEPFGVGERERRRRSGTGPPPPPVMPSFRDLNEVRVA